MEEISEPRPTAAWTLPRESGREVWESCEVLRGKADAVAAEYHELVKALAVAALRGGGPRRRLARA